MRFPDRGSFLNSLSQRTEQLLTRRPDATFFASFFEVFDLLAVDLDSFAREKL
jgi:hypothetical protein